MVAALVPELWAAELQLAVVGVLHQLQPQLVQLLPGQLLPVPVPAVDRLRVTVTPALQHKPATISQSDVSIIVIRFQYCHSANQISDHFPVSISDYSANHFYY